MIGVIAFAALGQSRATPAFHQSQILTSFLVMRLLILGDECLRRSRPVPSRQSNQT
jgi:hypothetical protein